MTNDDELLSAYVDGEATPEEVARVEGDPALRAEAAMLSALSSDVGRVPAPDPAVRAQHLGAALAAFDQLDLGRTPGGADHTTAEGADSGAGVGSDPGDDPRRTGSGGGGAGGGEVASLDAGRRRRAERQAGRSRGVPSWLGAAAASVAVVGGLGFALTQLSAGGDDSGEVATAALDEAADGGAEDAALDDSATDDAMTESLDAEESFDAAGAAEADGEMEAERLAGDGDDDEAQGGTDNQAADSAPTTTTGASTTVPSVDPAIEAARRFFTAVPDAVTLGELARGELLDPELSTCAEGLVGPPELTGFLPVTVADDDGELLVGLSADGEMTFTLVDSTCEVVGE